MSTLYLSALYANTKLRLPKTREGCEVPYLLLVWPQGLSSLQMEYTVFHSLLNGIADCGYCHGFRHGARHGARRDRRDRREKRVGERGHGSRRTGTEQGGGMLTCVVQ